ncbi:ESPR domain-containing protein [Burkholderia vietnamiensis]|uniref:ESPR domain-containing protein n=1 Tax=Burkholderia vietnamiensis TaxID=60552 RepID=UPI003C7D42BA
MNKIFKVVWSKSRSMFVVASEMATAHGGGSSEKSSCRSHADESLAHATRALKLKALVVAVCAAGGAAPTLALAGNSGMCLSNTGSQAGWSSAGGLTFTWTSFCDAPLTGTVGTDALAAFTENGTQLLVDGTNGNIYFRTGGSTGNVLTMSNVGGAGVLLSGLAPGAVTSTSKDAINGSQLYSLSTSTSSSVSSLSTGVSSMSTSVSSMSTSVSSMSTSVSSMSTSVSSMSTGVSSMSTGVSSLSTGLSTTNSAVSSLSTSTSTTASSLSTGVSSLSRRRPRRRSARCPRA